MVKARAREAGAEADQGRARRGEDRQVRPGWAKTASRALWPGARDVRAAKTPASALAVLVDAAGGRARRAQESLVGAARAAATPRPLAHHLDAIVDDLRHDGAQRERTDEEKAAGAAGIRARIQYLRSRCSDPAAIDAELSGSAVAHGRARGLSRVEALFANAQLEAAEDAEATAEAAGATAEAPAAADAAADEEDDDDDAEDDDDASSDGDASGDAVVDEAKERRRAERRAARKAEKKRLRDEAKRARAEESLRPRAAAARGGPAAMAEAVELERDASEAVLYGGGPELSRRLQVAVIKEVLLAPIASDGDGDPESLEELDGWYRPFLVESIMKSRPDLLAAHLICLPIDELELLFGGLIMVANGFPKHVEQIEYRIEHPRSTPSSRWPTSPRPTRLRTTARGRRPRSVGGASPSRPRRRRPAADDDDDDDDQVDHLKKRLLRDGQSTYVDKLSGFSFDMASAPSDPTARRGPSSRS
ncbi:hypothetical protein JL722_14944 [Aureococcus anophagefferens]|nr:hypothetical protein JL722_14944 [Aureococcus anophagefferens]